MIEWNFKDPLLCKLCLYNLAVACLIFDFQSFFLNPVNKKDIHLDLLRKLESNHKYTQRELSQEMEVSLGKINYCMKKMIEKGWLKAKNFQQSENKKAYTYFLTPKGVDQKSKLTIAFLQRKMEEYELLKSEIEKLKEEGKLWSLGKGKVE